MATKTKKTDNNRLSVKNISKEKLDSTEAGQKKIREIEFYVKQRLSCRVIGKLVGLTGQRVLKICKTYNISYPKIKEYEGK